MQSVKVLLYVSNDFMNSCHTVGFNSKTSDTTQYMVHDLQTQNNTELVQTTKFTCEGNPAYQVNSDRRVTIGSGKRYL